MDSHALPRAVLDEVSASVSKPQNWSDEYVQIVTDWARQFEVRGAIERHRNGERCRKPTVVENYNKK